jgi:hypothetical protein
MKNLKSTLTLLFFGEIHNLPQKQGKYFRKRATLAEKQDHFWPALA